MQRVATLVVLMAILTCAVAQSVLRPGVGTPQRKALLDALRPAVEKDLGLRVKFQVEQIGVLGNWAYVYARPLPLSGKRIDYLKTKYKTDVLEGAFEDGACALFKKTSSKWKLVVYTIGGTDAPYQDWAQKYKIPSRLFEIQ